LLVSFSSFMCTDDLHFIRQKKDRRAPGKKERVTAGCMSECFTGSIAKKLSLEKFIKF
jgi:hypothetical protein